MQACVRSSSSNTESEDGDLGLCGLGNFQWKYSLCKMSSLCYRSQFCRSVPAFCQGIALCLGVEVGKKRDWSRWASKLPSGPLSRVTWFEWETWTSMSLYQQGSLPAKLFGDFLCNGGKSRAFPSLPFKTIGLRTHKGSARQIWSSKLNVSWPVEIIVILICV